MDSRGRTWLALALTSPVRSSCRTVCRSVSEWKAARAVSMMAVVTQACGAKRAVRTTGKEGGQYDRQRGRSVRQAKRAVSTTGKEGGQYDRRRGSSSRGDGDVRLEEQPRRHVESPPCNLVSRTLTGLQQQFHHGEVGVGDGVVERRVPVAVCHVDHKLQQLRRDGGEGAHVGLDDRRVRRFVAGHAQPLLQHGGVGGPLRSDGKMKCEKRGVESRHQALTQLQSGGGDTVRHRQTPSDTTLQRIIAPPVGHLYAYLTGLVDADAASLARLSAAGSDRTLVSDWTVSAARGGDGGQAGADSVLGDAEAISRATACFSDDRSAASLAAASSAGLGGASEAVSVSGDRGASLRLCRVSGATAGGAAAIC
ncbi:hypothetical protein EYF80_019677 [Liparis tanakae]|uniref:Uncharacterized protein n=1 Tax=Liparis tanakae TaxID=230148 RepID=A0A4Z2HWP5_9TELE|nr:hypothetical protein EYF80_019677 [Liparis tanakae]